ncbi:ammonium transporter [Aquirhabdus sp.]|uniref:ammonium transporter n=1 Tax=Aquirhabdus sp. TaxID=2824160 RepID=UPI00396C5EDF
MKQVLLALGLAGALLTSTVSMADEASAPAATAVASAPAESAASAPAATAAPAPAAAATPAPAPKIDKGDSAWMLTSTALVLLMTIPGLALFYGGMVRRKNVLGTMMHSFAATAVVTVVWVVVGYSLAFGTSTSSFWAPYIGGLDRVLMNGVAIDQIWTPSGGSATTIPEMLFMVFQMTFAIITAALMSGAFAERMKFSAFMVFIALWSLVVYSPICHWVWHGQGWLAAKGALDFAGGTVVHINAGIAGLVAAYVLGRRLGLGKEPMAPHNLSLTVIGASLLWVGWFGFNAGSELAADARASMAMVVTQVATAAAVIGWLLAERLVRGHASVLGGASGAVAGLVAITPASGFVGVGGSLVIGLVAGVACFWGATGLKRILKADDSLDAFGVHAVGGIVGALLTAVFVTKAVTGSDPKPVIDQLLIQGEAVLTTLIYSGVMTLILLKIVDVIIGLRVSEEDEREGLDVSQHGERIE